jgi:hypothetical protein
MTLITQSIAPISVFIGSRDFVLRWTENGHFLYLRSTSHNTVLSANALARDGTYSKKALADACLLHLVTVNF